MNDLSISRRASVRAYADVPTIVAPSAVPAAAAVASTGVARTSCMHSTRERFAAVMPCNSLSAKASEGRKRINWAARPLGRFLAPPGHSG